LEMGGSSVEKDEDERVRNNDRVKRDTFEIF
jgi:hypothetical protein